MMIHVARICEWQTTDNNLTHTKHWSENARDSLDSLCWENLREHETSRVQFALCISWIATKLGEFSISYRMWISTVFYLDFVSTLEPSAGRLPIIFSLVVMVVMLSLLVALLCWFRHSISSYLRSKRCWQARCWWGTKPQQETNLVEQIVDDTQSDCVPVVPSAQRGDLMSTFPHSITI